MHNDSGQINDVPAPPRLIRLSEQAGKVSGTASRSGYGVWFHESESRCHRIACNNGIDIHQHPEDAYCEATFIDYKGEGSIRIIERYSDYDGDPVRATNVAILKCYVNGN